MVGCWHLHRLGALSDHVSNAVTMMLGISGRDGDSHGCSRAYPICRPPASPQGFTSALLRITAALKESYFFRSDAPWICPSLPNDAGSTGYEDSCLCPDIPLGTMLRCSSVL